MIAIQGLEKTLQDMRAVNSYHPMYKEPMSNDYKEKTIAAWKSVMEVAYRVNKTQEGE